VKVATTLNVVAVATGPQTTVAVDRTTLAIDEYIEITCSHIPKGTKRNWLAVVPPGGYWQTGMPWAYLPDNIDPYVMVPKVSRPGEHEAALYIDNRTDPDALIARSPIVTVTAKPPIDPGWDESMTELSVPLDGAFPLTSVYEESAGEIPQWGIVLGEQKLAEKGITLANGQLVHDGRDNEGAVIDEAQFTSGPGRKR
jgi:hypothetical protein